MFEGNVGNTYYDTLGVESTATAAEIKAAYKELASFHHPDKHEVGSIRKRKAEELTKELNVAYEILNNKRKRREYDESIRKKQEASREKEEVVDEENEPSSHSGEHTSSFIRALRTVAAFLVAITLVAFGTFALTDVEHSLEASTSKKSILLARIQVQLQQCQQKVLLRMKQQFVKMNCMNM
ncbi:MAG: J domain-containing protein [bacterium]|nr:J domain-containing protein [bacterium]